MGHLKHIDPLRRARGFLLSLANRIIERLTESGIDVFRVPSERYGDVHYHVYVDEDGVWVCTCEDYRSQQEACKHIYEVLDRFFPALAPPVPSDAFLYSVLNGPKVDSFSGYVKARRFKHIPHQYKEGPAESTRDDHAYEDADPRVEELVLDLAAVVNAWHPLPYREKGGRHTLPAGDRVAATVLRFHHRKSLRVAKPMMKRIGMADPETGAPSKIRFAACKSSLVTYQNSPKTLDYLREAFALTAHPFSLLEQDVVVDSSGASTFAVACWRDSDYGTKNTRPGTVWFKIHLARGRISGAVLGFIVTESHGPGSSDVANFGPLIRGLMAHGFDLRYVIVDNIYLTDDNINEAKAVGVTLVAPMKPRNFDKAGNPKTAAAKYMHGFKVANPKLYDELCRDRSAVESVFSSLNHYFDRVACIGKKKERKAAKEGGPELFVSRQYELWARILHYNFIATIRQEHRRNRRIAYTKGSVFSHVHETIDDDSAE